MRNLLRMGLGCVCLAWGAAAAYGQTAEASVSLGAGIFTDKNLGQISLTDTAQLKNGFRLSARLSINQWRFFGHEIGYGYNHTTLDFGSQGSTGMGVHQGFYDFLAHALPAGSPIRPFVCGGVGFASFFPPGTSVYGGNGITKFGLNYGGGVKVKLSPIYGVRVDVRDYVTGKPFNFTNVSGLLHNVEVSAGFSILF